MAMVILAAAAAGTGALGALQGARVGGDTALSNAKLRARELTQQAMLSDRQAQVADYAAQAERDATKFDAARHEEASTAFKSQQRADVAGSGLEATGSPLLVMSETARQLELDEQAIRHAGETRARGMEDDARLLRYQAEQLRAGIPLTLDLGRYEKRGATQQGQLGAIKSILGGASSAMSAYGGGYSSGGK
jgi:hypothetical protein